MKKEIAIAHRFTKDDLLKQLDKKSLELEQMKREHDFAQALEAALERVRSVTLNMNKSEELFDVIQLILDQFTLLKINVESASFALNPYDSNDLDAWTAVPGALYPFRIFIPYFDHPAFNLPRDAKNKGLDSITFCLNFEEKNQWLDHVYKHLHGVPEERKMHNYDSPGFTTASALRKHFALNIFNYSGVPYTVEELDVLKRFGSVLEQAYSRFLDLQNAETQAKEAIKSASLDRVRAQTASMRSTNDLQTIIPLLWNELNTLGVHFVRCGVFIMDEELQQINTFLSTPEGQAIASYNVPYSNPGLLAESLPYWRKKQMYVTQWNEADFMDQANNLIEQGAISSHEEYLTEIHPTHLHLHLLPFLQGMLYVGSVAPLSDEHLGLVQNLADAFSTAYARYEDFFKLELAKQQIEKTLLDLKQTQSQLIQSEKMASLGELTAGIAHEIQNPLNFVNNFSEVSNELMVEMVDEVDKGNYDEVKAIAIDVQQNLEKINHHGKRASSIVKGMLEHSRKSSGTKEPTDINVLADEYLRLAYQGLRAKDKDFNATLETNFDPAILKINVVSQDIGRVILNLITNAFYAVNERSKKGETGYEPKVPITTQQTANSQLLIAIKDNGSGIPYAIKDKIFQPFFTTKPTGQGTGLGLSLAYDIVKAHGGELKLESKKGEGTEFMIFLPL